MHPQNIKSRRDIQRSGDGRFLPIARLFIPKQKKVQRQKAFLQRKKERQRVIHENFLHAVCIPGTSRDSIPGSRSEGALVQILSAVVTKSHRIGPNGHVEGLREFCKSKTHLGVTAGVEKQYGNWKRNPRKLKGFRLPKLTRHFTEMTELRKWLESLEKYELQTETTEEALGICMKIIGDSEAAKQRKRNPQRQESSISRAAAAKYPNCNFAFNPVSFDAAGTDPSPDQNTTNSGIEEDCSHRANEPLTVRQLTFSSAAPSTEANLAATDIAESAPTEPSQVTSNGQGEEQSLAISALSDEDAKRAKNGKEIIETAKDDSIFVMLCSVFNEGLETPYGWYAGQFLKEYRRRGEEPTELMKAILTFCHWRCFGIRNFAAHERREQILRYNMDLLKKARQGLCLQSYEEIRRWVFNSAPHHYAGLEPA